MSKLTSLILLVVISVLFVVAGHGLVRERSIDGPTEDLAIGGDTLVYVSMIEGRWSAAAQPFKYRILVPLLARLLVLTPLDALRFISYLSLFASYLVILLTCSRLGLSILQSVFGLLIVFATTWHLYFYANPFLTDAFGLMTVCLLLFAAVDGSFLLFAVSAIFGALAREATLLLVPLWLLKDTRKGLLILAATAAVFAVPRLAMPSETGLLEYLAASFIAVGRWRDLPMFAQSVIDTWGIVWPMSILGMSQIPRAHLRVFVFAFIVLGLGAFFSSLVATDTGRMFSILTPVLAVGCAQLAAAVGRLLGRAYSHSQYPRIAM